jgi:DNA-binding Lrp family transcriptional regulator
MMKLDSLDRALLTKLQDDGRLSLRELGRLLKVPHTTVFTRVNKLIEKGIIKNFSAILHPHDLGFKLNYLVVDVPENESKDLAARVAECNDVMKVFRTGQGQLIVKAISSDDGPKCLDGLISKIGAYPVCVYPIEEVVKYDHRVNDDFIGQIE